MSYPVGLSFSPTQQNGPQNQPNASALTPVQQAIKILSLRIPQQGGASAITPTALLTAPGAAGVGAGAGAAWPADLLSLLRRLLMPGADMGPAGPTAAPAGVSSAVLPNIVPGTTPSPMSPIRGPGVPTQGLLPGPGAPVVDRTNPLPGTGNGAGLGPLPGQGPTWRGPFNQID